MTQLTTPSATRALTRLSFVGKTTAGLCWGLALFYIIMQSYLWLFGDMKSGIIASFSDIQPLLAKSDFVLSGLATGLTLFLDMFPVILTALVLLLIGRFFFNLSRNELWNRSNFKLLWIAGILNILSPFIYSLSWSLQSLAISLDLPPGEKIFSFSLGLNTTGITDIIVGIMLCAFAWMIKEYIKIHEENALYI